MTDLSLSAAMAQNITMQEIVSTLDMFSKTELPAEVVDDVRRFTQTYGKAKLVLEHNRYFVESEYRMVLRQLLADATIAEARVGDASADLEEITASSETMYNKAFLSAMGGEGALLPLDDDAADRAEEDAAFDAALAEAAMGVASGEGGAKPRFGRRLLRFEIDPGRVGAVKKAALARNCPLTQEYEYRRDARSPDLNMDLLDHVVIRPYQSKSLLKVFGADRARSGMIVLPCGAGKTLVGVAATHHVAKSTIVLCISKDSARQWFEQYQQFTNIDPRCVRMLISKERKVPLPDGPCLLITTYRMLANSRPSAEARALLQQIYGREWGLMILDEVHVAAAPEFARILEGWTDERGAHNLRVHCKLGLTATLVREDRGVDYLLEQVGPKLFEANWMDLTQSGYLAQVQCVEVWCEPSREFYREFVAATDESATGERGIGEAGRQLLALMNPSKLRVCERLVIDHVAKGDKVIVFCDLIAPLEHIAITLREAVGLPAYAFVKADSNRTELFARFKDPHSDLRVLVLSRVGDTAIDIPEASVIVELTSQGASRRQTAQRLGRILRPKLGGDRVIACYYTLVTTDSSEMVFAAKRQRYLVDQGYSFKVVRSEDVMTKPFAKEVPVRILPTPESEDALLHATMAMARNRKDGAKTRAARADDDEEDDDAGDVADRVDDWGGGGGVRRHERRGFGDYTGGGGQSYFELPATVFRN